MSEGPPPLLDFAQSLLHEKRFAEAEHTFRAICQHWPGESIGYNGLGLALEGLSRTTEASESFRHAIRAGTDPAAGWNNLGHLHWVEGRLEEAAEAFQAAVAIRPDFTTALLNLAHLHEERMETDAALDAFERVLYYKPGDSEANWNRALHQLLRGDYHSGFLGYEWRWVAGNRPERAFTQARWDGFPIEGKTILLHAEQGSGDTIQFARFADLVARRGAKVILECPRGLVQVLKGVAGVSQIIAAGDGLPPFDTHCPLLSLPWALRLGLDGIPASVPYLHADQSLSQVWQDRLAEYKDEIRIGIVWAGDPQHPRDSSRSTTSEGFERIANIPGVRLFSLQKNKGGNPLLLNPNVVDCTPELDDYSDTAALISQLDLVISVDTSIAHLAGALGRPVWTMLPYFPDWRWMLDREDSPWYPSMRLFRQTSRGDWSSVFDRIYAEVVQLQSLGISRQPV